MQPQTAGDFGTEVSIRNQMLREQKRLKEAREKGNVAVLEAQSDDEGNEERQDMLGIESPFPIIRFLDPTAAEEGPAEMARRLACESGAAWDKQQYEMIILCIWPLQMLWEFAVREDRLADWASAQGRLELIQLAGIPPVRIFAHGAGGSGKTFCLTTVVLPVYEWFMPGQCRRQAAQNSAARLIQGETMHARAGLGRNAKYALEEPNRRIKDKLSKVWGPTVFSYNDEIGAAAPGLYGTLCARAYWGKRASGYVDDVGPKRAPFGNPLVHVDAGDFAQLRPVPKGSPSLMEAFLSHEHDRARPLTDVELLGMQAFDLVATHCIEFQGTYRFKKGDPLIQLLQLMRKVGGAKIPATLREQILSRKQCGAEDPRSKPGYRLPNSVLGPVSSDNNFCNGMFSAVNWQQVARMQQIWSLRNARRSLGPSASQNTSTGLPQYIWQTFCPYLNRAALKIAPCFAKALGRKVGQPGQLLILMQRVDRAQVQQHANDKDTGQ